MQSPAKLKFGTILRWWDSVPLGRDQTCSRRGWLHFTAKVSRSLLYFRNCFSFASTPFTGGTWTIVLFDQAILGVPCVLGSTCLAINTIWWSHWYLMCVFASLLSRPLRIRCAEWEGLRLQFVAIHVDAVLAVIVQLPANTRWLRTRFSFIAFYRTST